MKKQSLFFSFLLFLCLFSACSKEKAPAGAWNMAEESQRKFTDSLVLTVVDLDPETNQITYRIQNPSATTYGYGTASDFKLEVLHNGIWHKMQHEPGWAVTRELQILNSGETKEYSTSLMAPLSAGTYRLIKEVHVEDGSQKSEFICCEFIAE